jgi:uncharacterized protein involved in propanediol utilization
MYLPAAESGRGRTSGHPTPLRALIRGRFERVTGFAPPPGELLYCSDIPIGHGMSSSTADAVALIRCLAQLGGLSCDERLVSTILHGVERSDPVFLDSPVIYATAGHAILETLGRAPVMSARWVIGTMSTPTATTDEDGLLAIYERSLAEYDLSRADLIEGYRCGDPARIFRAATTSARLGQRACHSADIDRLLRLSAELPLEFGVFRAHTGTVAGVIAGERHIDELEARLRAIFPRRRIYEGGLGDAGPRK